MADPADRKKLDEVKAFHKKCGMKRESQKAILIRSIRMRLLNIEDNVTSIGNILDQLESES